MIHSEVSFIIILFSIIYNVGLPIFCCMFCGNFQKTGKNISVFESSYLRSYFNLFLIYAVACDARKYKPSQIKYKQFKVDSSKDRLDPKKLS